MNINLIPRQPQNNPGIRIPTQQMNNFDNNFGSQQINNLGFLNM